MLFLLFYYIKSPEWLHGYIIVTINSATGFHKMGVNSGSTSLSTSQGRASVWIKMLSVGAHEEEDTQSVCHHSIPLRRTLGYNITNQTTLQLEEGRVKLKKIFRHSRRSRNMKTHCGYFRHTINIVNPKLATASTQTCQSTGTI